MGARELLEAENEDERQRRLGAGLFYDAWTR